MIIYVCDICKKKIDREESHFDLAHRFPFFTICESCGVPLQEFLKKYKLFSTAPKDN